MFFRGRREAIFLLFRMQPWSGEFQNKNFREGEEAFFFCLAVTQTRGVRNKSDITDQSSHVAKAIIAQINILNAVVMKLEGVIPGASNSSDKHQASSIF